MTGSEHRRLFPGPCLALAMALASAAAGAEGLLVNGGFEDLAGAQVIAWPGLTSADLTSTTVHSGAFAVAVDHAGSSGSGPMWEQGFLPTTAGVEYKLTGWLRCELFAGDGWGRLELAAIHADWSSTAIDPAQMAATCGTGRWHKLALRFTAEPGGTLVRFGVYGPRSEVTVFFDDLELFAVDGNLPPTLDPVMTPTTGEAPLEVVYQAGAADDDGAVRHVLWDFGDGRRSHQPDGRTTFRSRGVHRALVEAYDDDGARTAAELTVVVSDRHSPTVEILSPTTDPAISTSQATVDLGGVAQTALTGGAPLSRLLWDNLDLDEVGEVPAAGSWSAAGIPLRPGRNRLLVTLTDTAGRAATDLVTVERQLAGPRVSGVVADPGPVPVHGRWRATFDLETVSSLPLLSFDPSAPDPLDAARGVTAEAVVTLPDGGTVRQPAFFRPVVVERDGVLEETGEVGWELRLSPRSPGRHEVELQVEDASGSATLELGGFDAVAAGLPGPVEISAEDPRYFVRAGGGLFFPIGPALEPGTQANDGVLNLARPWLGGFGGWSGNWSRWISPAERHGNEGFMAPLSFLDRAPGSELSMWLGCSSGCGADDDELEGWRLWQGFGIDGTEGRFVAGRTYRVVLRLRTDGLVAASPGPFGVTMKLHGWKGTGQTWKEYLDGLPSSRTMVAPVAADRPWHTMVETFIAPVDASHVSLYLTNVAAGRVSVDTISVRELDLLGRPIGGELMRNPKADLHLAVDPRGAAAFERLLERAESDGVTLKIVVQDKNDWIPNHLTPLGFFAAVGGGYYQEEDTRWGWLQRQWWRHLAARWAPSSAIHSFELNNEGSPDAVEHYRAAQRFARFFSLESAHPRLATTSFWCCWRPAFWGDQLDYPDVGYADLHEYTDTSDLGPLQDELEGDLAALHLHLVDKVRATPVGKPVLRAESGVAASSPAFALLAGTPNPGLWFHNLLWAQLDGAAVFDTGYWWSEHFRAVDIFLFGADLGGRSRVELARGFARFVAGLELHLGGFVDLATAAGHPDLRVVGQRRPASGVAHAWIQNRRHTWRRLMLDPGSIVPVTGAVSLATGRPGAFEVSWWDTTSGVPFEVVVVDADDAGVLVLEVVGLASDVAVTVRPRNTAEPLFADGFESGDVAAWSGSVG